MGKAGVSRKFQGIFLLAAALLASVTAWGKVIYVDTDAIGADNGSSWADAYKFLQNALTDANSSAKPVEIRVAEGTYRPDEDSHHPDGTGNREATFQLISGVTLKGGYAGFGQPDPNARDIELCKTILRACEKIPVCLRFRAGGAGQIAGWWYKRDHEHGRHNSAIVTEWE